MRITRFFAVALALLTLFAWNAGPLSTTAYAAPAGPTGLAARSAGTTWVDLSWDTVSSATVSSTITYDVFSATSSGGSYTKRLTSNKVSCRVSGLIPNTTYWFKVRATVDLAHSALSIAISKKTLPALAVPMGLKATAFSANRIDLLWTAVSGAQSYHIYRSVGASTAFTPVATITAAKFSNIGLLAGVKYNYKVRAKLSTGYSGFCAVVSSFTKPAVPLGIKAVKYSASKIKVSWSAVKGATNYKIYVARTVAGVYTLVAKVNAPTLLYIHTGLAIGSYYYKVTAVIGALEGVKSAYVLRRLP